MQEDFLITADLLKARLMRGQNKFDCPLSSSISASTTGCSLASMSLRLPATISPRLDGLCRSMLRIGLSIIRTALHNTFFAPYTEKLWGISPRNNCRPYGPLARICTDASGGCVPAISISDWARSMPRTYRKYYYLPQTRDRAALWKVSASLSSRQRERHCTRLELGSRNFHCVRDMSVQSRFYHNGQREVLAVRSHVISTILSCTELIRLSLFSSVSSGSYPRYAQLCIFAVCASSQYLTRPA